MESNLSYQDKRTGRRFEVIACSGIGKRECQQDAAGWYEDDGAVYAVLCDGMGGLGGGELASATAIQEIQTQIPNYIVDVKQSASWMRKTVQEANQKVYALKNEAGEPMGCGSTMVAVLIQDDKLYWVSVGDSRAYIFRAQEAVQMTTDLNYFYLLKQRLQSGEISQENYDREADSGDALISFLGLEHLSLIDQNTEPLRVFPGDKVLLCSDGLYRTIDALWMRDILSACGELSQIPRFIHDIIDEHGDQQQDNYTCVLIQINGSDKEK